MDDFELDWDDDNFLDGDIDFNDDFDMDPYKNKSFISGAMDGLIGSIVGSTVGSSDAIIRTARTYLPKSYTTALDRIAYFKSKGEELVREFQEGNYESVKSLQSIAKTLSGKIGDKNPFLSEKLDKFTNKDFSSWEKSKSKEESLPSMEEATNEEKDSLLASIMDNQTSVISKIGENINEMAAQIGGRTISSIMAGNKELIGIQSNLRDLLDYQRKVQAKMDYAKIDILAKTYVLNAKFYKFMEKGLHKEIQELKKIADWSSKSDYEKTTNYQAAKKHVRNVVFERAGGFLSSIKDKFGKSARKDAYYNAEDLISSLATALEMSDGLTPSAGMFGEMAGGYLGEFLLSRLPTLFNQGPFQKLSNNIRAKNPELAQKYDKFYKKFNDVGNLASYNLNSLGGVLQYYGEYWEDLEEDYRTYEEYKQDKEDKGEKPLPKTVFTAMKVLGNFGKNSANSFMRTFGKSTGSRYNLRERDVKSLSKASVWKEVDSVALTDVIPGLLRLQYESLEKIRTGNDNFVAPIYSYKRGEFVSTSNAKKVLQSDIFNHSSFSSAATSVNRLVDKIDSDKVLTRDERNAFAMSIMKNIDKGNEFNPFYYIDGIESKDQNLNERIGKIIRNRFGITDEMVKKHEKGDALEKAKMAAFGLKGEGAANLNEIGVLAKSLSNSMPNLEEYLDAALAGGNSQLLRELGIIYTKNGRDQFNMDKYWERMFQYLQNPDDIELRGELNESGITNAGSTNFGRGNLSRRDASTISRGSRHINDAAERLGRTSESTTKVLNETIEKLSQQMDVYSKNLSKVDFSNLQINLSDIPDTLSSIRDIVVKMEAYNSRQESLLEQIAGCVCRSAGGWGNLTDQEKKKVLREEKTLSRSLLDRIRDMKPRDMFNRGIDALIRSQPLVLGGLLGGVGMLALHDPKAAMLVSGGMLAASIYTKIGNIAKSREPSNDEDILDENGEVLLSANKLRNGDYYDLVTRAVIREWKDIKGGLKDVISGTYIAISRLTGKLFGKDGRAIILKGLSKVKDTIVNVWNKIDILNNLSKLTDKAKDLFYQQDVYVKGEKEPRLTRSGFQRKVYYCYDLNTNTPFVLTGWNDIKGPVYKLEVDGTLTQIISEAEVANGLVTSTGYSIDRLGQLGRWTGTKLLEGLGKTKDYALEKAGIIKEHVKDTFKTDFTGVEDRIDRIYLLLCKHFGYQPNTFGLGDIRGLSPVVNKPDSSPIDDLVESVSTKQDGRSKKDDDAVVNPFEVTSQYPNKIRLNSLQDQENKKEKEKQDKTREDISDIAEYARQQTGKGLTGNKDEKKDSFLSKVLGGVLGFGGGLLKFIKNPIGFMGGVLVDTMLKAPGRIIKMGQLLFKGVLGPSSMIYKVLRWGFGGVMWGLRKMLFSTIAGTTRLGNMIGGGVRRGGRAAKGIGKFFRGMRGKWGMIGNLALTAAGAYGYSKMTSEIQKSEKELSGFGKEYEDFYGNPESDLEEDTSMDPVEAGLIGLTGLQAAEAANSISKGRLVRSGAKAARKIGSKVGVHAGELAGKVASKIGSNLAVRAGLRGGSRLVPILGQLAMGYDFVDGFRDKDALKEIFKSDFVNARQQTAHGIANLLDFGGVFSGLSNVLADKTGWEFLRAEGGATRAIDKILELSAWGPFKYISPLGWISSTLSNIETDLRTPQAKLCLAMYGIKDLDSQLAKSIGVLEKDLDQYVRFGQDRCWMDQKTPYGEILKSFLAGNEKEFMSWFRLRFLPIYLTFQSGLRMVGFNGIAEFNQSKDGKVLSVVKQVKTAIMTIKPYPYDIVANFDAKIGIMSRQETESLVSELTKELDEYFKDLGINKDGVNTEVRTKFQTAEDMKNGKSASDASWFTRGMDYLNEQYEETLKLRFKEDAKVINIDISDLHKNVDTPMDYLTIVRLFVYGCDSDNGARMDTVLRLERFCENYTSYANGRVNFSLKTQEVFNIFKNSFRVEGPTQQDWITWFETRFLPVFKNWFGFLYDLRRNKPKEVWKTLSATNRFECAKALSETIVSLDGKPTSIWDVEESPFPLTRSNNDASTISGYMNNLEKEAADARLKKPSEEANKSKPKDLSMDPKERARKEHEMMMRMTGHGRKSSNQSNKNPKNDITNSPYYKNTVNKALGNQGFKLPGGEYLNQLEMAKGNGPIPGLESIPNLTTSEKVFNASQKEAEKIIIREFRNQGITDPRVLAFALANAKAETEFEGKVESLNYTPENLMKTFKSTFGRRPQEAYMYGRTSQHKANQPAIAGIAYGNILGNNSLEDGWRYRGRGFTQLTGKANYATIGNIVGEDYVNHPELISEDITQAAKSAAGFFKANPKIINAILAGNIEGAASLVGKEQGGISKKRSLYPLYYKRITEGDLKDIASGVESNTTDNEQNKDNQINSVNPQPTTSITKTQSDVIKEVNASPVNQGMNSYNAPPTTPEGTPDTSATSFVNSGQAFITTQNSVDIATGNRVEGYGNLKIKSEETVGGGPVHPGLKRLAEIIQSEVPDFKQFTAFNDRYHQQKNKNSKHVQGLALDFTTNAGAATSDAACNQVHQIMSRSGLGKQDYYVKNEYKENSKYKTGGHVHFNFTSDSAANKFLQGAGVNLSRTNAVNQPSQVSDNQTVNPTPVQNTQPAIQQPIPTNNNNTPSYTPTVNPTPVSPEPVKQPLDNGNGVVAVSDEGVVKAIANLSETLMRAFNSQSSLRGNSQRVSLN